jgi:hypothetical protein
VKNVVLERWPVRAWVLLAIAVCSARGDTFNFSNTNSVTISTDANPPTVANPYPSTLAVSGLDGEVITNITVTLNGFTHPFPSDVSIILAGPQGQMAMLMSDVGGAVEGFPVTNLTLVLDDSSGYPLPVNDSLFSGTFHPTSGSFPLFFDFPPPAPAGNSNAPAALSVFDGTDPNGNWNLFVVDDFTEVTNGYISGGWSMAVSVGVPLQITNSTNNVVLSWPAVTGHTFSVQYSPSVTNAVWTNLSAEPATNSGRYFLTNAKAGPTGVFRLIVQ